MGTKIDKSEEWGTDSIKSYWDRVLAEKDEDVRVEKINEFINHYAMNQSLQDLCYLDEACKELESLVVKKQTNKDWIAAIQQNEIFGYVDFIKEHPDSKYCDEANRRIEKLKRDLLTDMRQSYFDYPREAMYRYIGTNVLSEKDLVVTNNILTRRAYNHIKRYPSPHLEQQEMPKISYDDTDNKCINGNIDVLFFGVCGSGGKTCMMASLMTLVGQEDFIYQKLYNNIEYDNVYGHYLADHLNTDRLPPATDQRYIQVVNTLIKINAKFKGVSFIEFAGEQVFALAGNSREEGLSTGGITPTLIKILNNKNKKIIFLTIDPTSLKNVQIYATDTEEDLWVSQPDVLSCVISHFKNAPKFMRNVIGFHTIISKSDLWLKGENSADIESVIKKSGAKGLLLQIEQLCDTYKIKSDAKPIPFSIGKFMPGYTYEFDDKDAKKLLQLIRTDIEAYEKNSTILSRLKNFIHS